MTAALHDTKTYVALGPDDTQHECADNPLRVHASGRTHIGRVRKTNEDHFLVGELSRRLTVRATSLEQPATRVSHCRGHVFLVADGMGGHRAGETASALSVLSIESFLLNSLKRFICCEWADDGVMREFRQALEQADTRIIEEATTHPEMMGMGTTMTLAFVIERRLYVAHVGDSRCYRFAGGRLEQITKDHTVAAELVAHGLLSAEQAERSPFRNSITNALGGGERRAAGTSPRRPLA